MIAASRLFCVALLVAVAGQSHAQTVKSQYSVDTIVKSMTSSSASAQASVSASGASTDDCPGGRTSDGDCPPPKASPVQGFSIAGLSTTPSKPVNTLPNPASAPAAKVKATGHKAEDKAYAAAAPAETASKFDMLITFEKNSSNLTSQAQANAQTFAQALNTDSLKSRRLMISGHTDKKGSRELNLALSEKRAEAVKAYLVSQGVDGSRLDTHGYGFDRPLPNHPATDPDNRRVEASLLN